MQRQQIFFNRQEDKWIFNNKGNWKKRGLSELKKEDRAVGEKWNIDMKQLNMKEIPEY